MQRGARAQGFSAAGTPAQRVERPATIGAAHDGDRSVRFRDRMSVQKRTDLGFRLFHHAKHAHQPTTGETLADNQLYRTDGTAAGTSLVWSAGSDADRGEAPEAIQVVAVNADRVFFSMKDELHIKTPLYVSDGTAAGTVELFDQYYGDATEIGGTLYFGGMDPAGRSLSLYKTDGTVAGTGLVERDLMGSSGIRSIPDFAQAGGKLFFIATYYGTNFTGSTNGTFGSGVWVSDGSTMAGTTELGSASTPDALAAIGSTVYFGKNEGTFDNYAQLWKTNGTQAGTVLVKDLVPGTSGSTDPSPSHLTAAGNTLYFTGSNGSHGIELRKSNGTEAGTTMVEDIRPGKDGSTPTNLTPVGNTLFFIANDGSHGSELWRSNGTEAGTYMVKDVGPGGVGGVANLTEAGGLLYFSGYDGSKWQLWRSDGSAEGT
jgi:ELWxxDGT repeat protein